MKEINKEGIRSIALLGGTKLINSFIKENLIDEIKITIVPKIIGGGFTWIQPSKALNIYNFRNNWIIQSIRELNTNEIFIHYAREKRE